MNIYYIVTNPSYKNKYNFMNIIPSSKTINNIKKEILSIPNFCRNQNSISSNELQSYVGSSGISFFTEKEKEEGENNITGLVNFDINKELFDLKLFKFSFFILESILGIIETEFLDFNFVS